jgi:hypothetical protein
VSDPERGLRASPAAGARPARISLPVLPLAVLLGCAAPLAGQADDIAPGSASRLAWSTEATEPSRFLAVHGRRAALFGYSEGGLEAWAYPVQILNAYRVSFRQEGATTDIEGQAILRRIIYSPEAVTRIYVGPDFIVRERLFVPLELPGAIVSYETQGARPVALVIRFNPVLDLMWPASIGGQESRWDAAASAYLLSEPLHRFTASIGSPDIVSHDDTVNATQRVSRAPGLAFTVRAGGGRGPARVIIAAGIAGADATAVARTLLEQSPSLEEAAAAHYRGLLDRALQIETPDPLVNRALAWSEIALDQAWVCNVDLGCGVVAGYGPARKARRPQYDWFFAGDGMIATRALLAAGEYDRAREELEFILKYQDPRTGMVWHELTQSARYLDWKKYPYLYIHVDLSFDFLNSVDEYFSVTGDLRFVKDHWKALESAYRYCRSLLDPHDGLPRIPGDKEGANEQDPLGDELALSASWVAASASYADLAAAAGHPSEAQQARRTSEQARQAVTERYWDARRGVWISAHTRSGAPVTDPDLNPAALIRNSLLAAGQRDALLDRLASADFQADWGTRSKAVSAASYDPNAYASGSVWALGTAGIAGTYWSAHRPLTALSVWDALLPWSSLDSLGHMHEVLAGDYYHPEVESVPEQTWSSASFLSAAVEGLLGLTVQGASGRLTFAPHLPPDWSAITVRHLRLRSSELTLEVTQAAGEVRLKAENAGAPVPMLFAPEIPLGARLRDALLDERRVAATLEQNPQDTHARVELTLAHGSTQLTIGYRGGVAILPAPPRPEVGEPSRALKVTGVSLAGRLLTLELDYPSVTPSGLELRTRWAIKDVQGATAEAVSPGTYRLKVGGAVPGGRPGPYQHGKVTVTFADVD